MRFKAVTLIPALLGVIGLVGCGGSASSNSGGGGGGGGNPTLQSISISPTGPAVTTGSSVQLTATGTYSDKSTKDLTSSATWSVDHSSIATVSAGKVTGSAVGIANVTAASGSVSASTPVNVTSQNVAKNALSGSYAFFLTTVDSRGQAVIVGSFTTDGNGNITQGIADFNTAKGVSNTGPVNLTASTYTLWPDGRGEADITLNSQTFHVAFVLSDFVSGVANKGKMISFDSNNAFGEFELQTANANLNTSASYVFGFNGLDSSNKAVAEIGIFNTGASLGSPSSGSYDIDDNGTIDGGASPPGPSTALPFTSVTINTVSTGNRGTATLGTTLGTATYAFYTVDSTKAYFIETDTTGAALAGAAELQTAKANSVSPPGDIEPLTPESTPSGYCVVSATGQPDCNYAFLLDHTASTQNGTFEKAGQIGFCPCNSGGIDFDREDDDADGKTWVMGTGSRGFDTTGRGLLTYPVINGSTMGGNRYAIVYVVSNTPGTGMTTGSSRVFMMNTDSGDASPGIGVADFIDAAPQAVPVAGSYAFNATSIGDTNLLELGQVDFSGSNLTGIAYINSNGTLSTVAVSGTFAPSTTLGDGRGAISPFNSTTNSLTVYSVGSQGLILLGAKPDINGRMQPQ
jgi:hypothetical protein